MSLCYETFAGEKFHRTEKPEGKEHIKMHHYVFSFKGQEVTPEDACYIAEQWAKKVFGNKYQILIAVHTDTDNIHVHVAVNAYSLNGKRWLDNKKTLKLCKEKINKLWHEMEFDWYTKGGESVIYWHWSPEYAWEMNFPLEGYNECLITYILGASSPTHSIPASAYHKGWARSGGIVSDKKFMGLPLVLKYNGCESTGGPLFWSHYSYIGLDPRGLKDDYANYWELTRNHAMTDYLYCVSNPKGYKGYGENCWGLTASYTPKGYSAHSPANDLGVITPTAALSSFPYTPEESMRAAKYFYGKGEWLRGKYGFYDAFSETDKWVTPRYLAIDQLTIAPMIENYRSGLLWRLFMGAPEIQQGLKKLGFTSTQYNF